MHLRLVLAEHGNAVQHHGLDRILPGPHGEREVGERAKISIQDQGGKPAWTGDLRDETAVGQTEILFAVRAGGTRTPENARTRILWTASKCNL